MAYELKDMSGSLFRNTKRDKETQPNAKGEAKILGIVYEVAAWTKKDKNGNPWQSLSFKVKDQRPEQTQQPAKPAVDESDDVPF